MFTICSRHRPSRRSPGRRSDGPGQGPVKPESAGFGPIPGKTRGFLADTSYLMRNPNPVSNSIVSPCSNARFTDVPAGRLASLRDSTMIRSPVGVVR